MSLLTLRADLALWSRRYDYRQGKLADARRTKNFREVEHWRSLFTTAGAKVHEIEDELARAMHPRDRVCGVAETAAANYRANPGAYHYLAGGIANTEILKPTPRNWRSDCSQFAVNLYRLAGLPCPGSGSYLSSNTISIAARGRVTLAPEPGDLGLYGSRWNPHHVELLAKGHFIGHGSPPIDSLTPGLPSFYLSFIN